jgi:hypothetical protein
MEKKSSIGSVLQTIILLLILGIVLWNIYTGATIQEIGIPGLFTIKFGNRQQPSVVSKQLIVKANPNPLIINHGGDAEISVHVTASDGSNVPDAEVTIRSAGGFFEGTGVAEVGGPTNGMGDFHALWHAKGALPASFVIDAEVNKPNFDTAHDFIQVHVNSP